MTQIENLIAKFSAAGVEHRPIGEVITNLRTGLNPRKNFQLNTPGASNLYMTVRELGGFDLRPSEKTDRVDDDGLARIQNRSRLRKGDVLFSGTGTIGRTALVSNEPHDWNIKEGVYALTPRSDRILSKFLIYALHSRPIRNQIISQADGSTVASIPMATLRKVLIPVPPLEVQREIVRILDHFTELEADLEAELEARRRQYAHYRDRLLTPNDTVRWSTLGNVSTRVSSGGTPRAGNSKYYSGGEIPWLRTNEVKFGEVWDTEVRITNTAIKETSAKWIPENCVIIAISGATAGRSAINKIPMTTNQHCCNLEIDPNQADYKYVFYWVATNYESLKSLGRGARSDLNSTLIKNFTIPVPSLEKQRQIVAVLDKFDALVNNPSVGLPAELVARRKQYEYYRDRLLTCAETTA